MKKAYIDLTDFDVQRGSLRKSVDRAIAQTENQYSPVIFLARPSHASEVESALTDVANCSVVSVTGMTEVLTHIQSGRKRSEGFVPNAATDYVFTYSSDVRSAVMGWKASGWNVYTRWASDLLAYNAPVPSSADSDQISAGRSRNRKYEVAKHKAKKLRVYAEWRARKPIYDAMEKAISARGETLMLSDLKRNVMRQGRKDAADAGFDLQANHFYAANDSVFKVAVSVGVFKTSGGRSISDQDVAYVVPVIDIDPDFRNQCDLFILECVINELGDVTDEHCLSLAHLMYGEGQSETDGGVSLDLLEEKFANLMKLFGDRLHKNQIGYYHVAPKGGEKVQAITVNSR